VLFRLARLNARRPGIGKRVSEIPDELPEEACTLRRRRAKVHCAVSLAAVLAIGLLAGCSAGTSSLPPQAAAPVQRFTAGNWTTLAANPNAFRGSLVSFVGQVFQPFDKQSTPPNIQLFVLPMGVTAVAVVTIDSDPHVKNGSYVAVEGHVLGEFKGKSPFEGATGVTPVLVQATSLEATAGPPSGSQ
jgi:hypothetical protein